MLLIIPGVYLFSLAVLLSAYVHGHSIPSRQFLKVYAMPSNTICSMPGLGPVYKYYFDTCVRITGADYSKDGRTP